jgi:hypothetical protein
MKKILLISLLFFSGCAIKTSLPESKTYINNTDFSKINQMKTGEACRRHILFFTLGNKITSKQAAINGGISKIKYQEVSHTNFWPFYSSECIKVYGE